MKEKTKVIQKINEIEHTIEKPGYKSKFTYGNKDGVLYWKIEESFENERENR